MSIDDKDPSVWREPDLAALCEERRRETQRLEFKGTLKLDTDRQKRDVEEDAQGMAYGGGGVIIYGISEVELADGGFAAGSLTPLADGSLFERLREVLDTRGQPRLMFDLHVAEAANGGTYLILEVSGRRRPHQANDGRYYGRRGTSVRRLDEGEIAEAYRERFLREAQAIQPLLLGDGHDSDLPADVAERVHRGLTPAELALRDEDTGDPSPPGWLSVVVYPEPRRPSLLDPIRDAERFGAPLKIPDQWDPDQAPLQHFYLQPMMAGLRAQLPPRDDWPPAFLVSMYRDGVMEYGTTLEPALRRDDPGANRIIFSASHTYQTHDYLQAFAVALQTLGYEGSAAAQVSFYHTYGVNLGIARDRLALDLHPIEEPHIRGELWHGEVGELIAAAGRITKQVMDLVFLSAGIRTGCWLVDDTGHLVRQSPQ
jgi:hypothetical protein